MALSQRRSALVRRLRRRRERTRESLVLVEGVRAVEEALSAGAQTEFAVIAATLPESGAGAAIGERLSASGVPTEVVTEAELRALADTEQPQGVILVCRQPDTPVRADRSGRYLVLDAVQDPGNVGTLIRSAVAFGLDGVLVLDGTADPWGPKAVRASTGLVFRIPVELVEAGAALERLAEVGVPVLVADASGDPVRTRPRGGWALVVGNEGAGVRDVVARDASETLRVPMPGPAESLNAGVAAAILLYAMTSEAEGA